MSAPAYVALDQRCARLDRRHTRYRFDEERDIPWAEQAAPGLHFGPAYLEALGLTGASAPADPEAFQWAMALATCEAVHKLEELILRFCAAEAGPLGPSRSVDLLCEEEAKHMRVFARYAAQLRAARPDLAERFAAAFAPSAALLERLHEREAYPSAAAYHYMFWINTVFFEEYTIWIDGGLSGLSGVQPVWRALHSTHRQEEVQHVATDAAHLEALNLSAGERAQLSKLFLLRLEEGFDRFFGVEAALTLAGAPADAPPRALRELPLFRLLLESPAFRQTRRAAPYLGELARRPPPPPRAARPPALLRGATLPPPRDASLAAALVRVAAARPQAGVTLVDDGGEERRWTYAELLDRARGLLPALSRAGLAPGRRVALLLPDPGEFLPAFWACQLAGAVPVPLGRSLRHAPEEDLERVAAILARLGDPLLLVEAELLEAARQRFGAAVVRSPAELEGAAGASATPAAVGPEATALIQFSSGSTRQPRGVVLSQANVLANLEACRLHQGVGPEDVVLSWMPLHHDMGLGYHLCPLVSGASQVLLTPLRFARRPLAWLEALSRHRATITAAPNFALAQTLRRLRSDRVEGLDLSRLRCLLDGAEPISRPLLDRFAHALGPAGLRREAIRPAYGLAEATVAVAMSRPGAPLVEHLLDREALDDPAGVRPVPPGDPRAAGFVAVGVPVPGVEVRVCDRAGRPLAEDVVGEVEVRGPNVTRGYLDDPAATAAALRPDGWLRTGDLGLIRQGELVISGRLKDVVFVGGRNYLANDLEEVLRGVEGVAEDRVAVVGATDPRSGLERVVPFVRLAAGSGRGRAEVVAEVADRLGQVIAYPVEQVVVLPADLFPRTTSGKVQRHRLREALERGELDAYRIDTRARGEAGRLKRQASGEWPALPRTPATPPHDPWVQRVREAWGAALDLDPAEIGLDESFFSLGGDSIRAVEAHTRLEELAGRLLDGQILRERRTVRETAAALRALGAAPAPAPATPVAAPVRAGDVAVIGMAGRFPGAPDLEAYWSLLAEGRVATGPVPRERFDVAALHDPDPSAPGKTVCREGGFLDEVRAFDAEAFGIPAREARQMDPQQRLFLEVAADALAAAGVRTPRVGVYAGGGHNEYFQLQSADLCRLTGETGPANLDNMIAARLSQALGLTGPALTVNAACATSLVAVHLACRALQAGECEVALAGGVELNLTPLPFVLFSQAGVLSANGRCRPFAAEADGFVPGEGVGAVVLKPLAQALADDDPILGVIKGSAVNNDGGALSGMAPNPAGQREVLRAAYRQAEVDPATVGYVEAHGTGTRIGDAVEVRSLSQVFGEVAPRGSIGLGSVKANLGHALNAAGIASLIKVLLALRQGELPPTPGCETPDPRIGFEETPFFPVTRRQRWRPAAGAPRRAGISAFGIGGTNCHLIVEEAPARAPVADRRDAHLLCLTAPDEAGLERVASRLARSLEGLASPAELGAWVAAVDASAHRFPGRTVCVVRSPEEARAALGAPGPLRRASRAPRLTFLLPGPGSQFPGMAAHLLDEPDFAEALAACDAVVAPLLGRSLQELLRQQPDPSLPPLMDRIECSQPVVFACSWALARWLERLGVRPDAVIGHSAGEYAAAALAGSLTLEQAARLVTLRGLHMSRTEPGRMAAVFAGEEAVRPFLGPRVGVAALNEPGQVVLSGGTAELEAVLVALRQAGIESRLLPIGCAAHSPLMTPAREAFAPDVGALPAPRTPALPYYSALVGARVSALEGDYWLDHLRAPVRFASAVRAALADGARCFLDLGASAVLSPCVEQVAEELGPALGEPPRVIPLLRRSQPGWTPTLEGLAALLELGLDVDLVRLAGPRRRSAPALPGYPWRRREHWQEPPRTGGPGLGAATAAGGGEAVLGLEDCAPVRDHRVHGRPIAPAALLLDLALEALAPDGAPCALEEILIGRPLALEPGPGRRVRVRPAGPAGATVLESTPEGEGEPGGWTEHLAARFVPLRRSADWEEEVRDLPALRARCGEPVPPEAIYGRLSASGLSYGPSVRTLVEAWRGPGELLARLELPTGEPPGGRGRLDPGLVDGAMQAIAGLTLDLPAGEGAFLGFSIRRLAARAPVRGPCLAHVRLRGPLTPGCEAFRCDVELLGLDGGLLARFEEVGLKRFHPRDSVALAGPPARALAVGSEPAPAAPRRGRLAGSSTALLVGRAGPLRTALEREVEARGGVALALEPGALRGDLTRPPAGVRWGGELLLLLLEPELEELAELATGLARAGVDRLGGFLAVGGDEACLGFLRALDRERPGWRCRALVLAEGEPPAPDELAARCLALLQDDDRLAEEVRDGEARVPTLRPLVLVAPDALPAALVPPRAVIWITGGLGGIGLAIGELLAARAGARLLITGRRAHPDPEAVARLERAGGEVLYVPADAADRAAMRRALEVARDAWGQVQGAIHAAGVLADVGVAQRSPERSRAVLGPKRDGGRVLAEVTEGEPLGFLAFCSSLAGLTGVAGQTDYAAANAGLDGLARRLRRGGTVVVSLAWGPWRDVGMVREERYQAGFLAQGLRPLDPARGAAAFLAALATAAASGERRLALLDLDPRREPELRAAFNRPAGSRGPARARATSGPAAAAVLEFARERLARLLRRPLDQLDPAASFPSLGVDSLMAVGLVRELERRFQLRLYPTLLFELDSLDALAEHLAARHGAEVLAAAAPTSAAEAPRVAPLGDCQAWEVGLEPGQLTPTALELAAPGPGEVELEVRAVGVNFIDLLACAGSHPVLGAGRFVPGHEVAGVVRRIGPGVTDLAPGARVVALLGRGGYAARALAPRAACLPLPEGLDFPQGAAVLIAGLTAIACVELKGRVRAGERVLVQAAAGATGLACVQLALHHGAEVLGTASQPAKLTRLRELGVAHAIDYRAEPFPVGVRRATRGEGVDVVIDSLSGEAIEQGLALLRPGGRFVEIGAAGVVAPPPLDPRRLFLADLDFSTVNVARLEAAPERLQRLTGRLAELLRAGVLRPEVGHQLPFAAAAEALQLLRERRNLGKVVLLLP